MKIHSFCLLVFFVTLISACSSSEKKQANKGRSAVFESIKQNQQSITIDPSQSQLLTMDDGVDFLIAKGALVDKQGDQVTGDVELIYKSYNSSGSIIASGIPMTVRDEAGEERQLESAGMFDLRAFSKGEEVFIKKGKDIQVTLPSEQKGDFDLYFYEETTDAYPQQAVSLFDANPTLAVGGNERSSNGGWKKLKTAVKKKFKKIEKGQEFKLNWNLERNSEFKDISRLKWQYGDVDSSMNPFTGKNKWVLDHEWNTFKISQPKFYAIEQGTYTNDARNGFNYIGYKNGYEVFETKYPHNTYLFNKKTGDIKVIEGFIARQGFWNRVSRDRYSLDFQYHDLLRAQTCFVIKHNSSSTLYDQDFNKIKELGRTGKLMFYFDKQELVYATTAKDDSQTVLRCIKPDGILVREKTLPYGRGRISHDGKYFSLNADGGYSIYSTSTFELVAQKKFEGYDGVYVMFGGNHGLWMQYADRKVQKMSFWHWGSGEIISFPKSVNWRDVDVNPFTGTIITLADDKSKRVEWDWRTKSYTDVEYTRHISPHVFPGNEVMVMGSNLGSKTKVFDRNGKNPFICSNNGPCYGQESNFSGDRFYNIANDSVQLYDKFGQQIKSFGYRCYAVSARWVDDNTILVKYEDGSQGYYDKDGQVSSFFKGTIPFGRRMTSYDKRYTMPIINNYSWTPVATSNGRWGNSVYDSNGDLVLDLTGRGTLTTFGFDPDRFCTVTRKGVSWYDRTDEVNDTTVYRLTLLSGDSTFVTTVHLSPDQLKLLEKYVGKHLGKKNKVSQTNVLRTFQISRFGIYNFDRYYEDDLIPCKANFELTVGEFPTEANVFLITGENGRVVVKFWSGTWDKFYLSSTWDCQILVELPDERIALFDKQKFRNLDKEFIKKEGKYTFKLKVFSKRKSVKELEEILSANN